MQYLPANTISRLQPLDRGIIETTKRRFLLQAVVMHIYQGKDSDLGVARYPLDQQYSEENPSCCNEAMLQEGQRFQECCRRRQAGRKPLSGPPEQS